MAVDHTLPKSTPDLNKLKGFNGYMMQVTRHLAPKALGQQIMTAQKVATIDQVLGYVRELPIQNGAGFYRFEVTDTGGTGTDTWMVKIGDDQQQFQEVSMPVLPGGMPHHASMPAAPLGDGVEQILPGYFFNPVAGLLQLPNRRVIKWQPGDSIPVDPPSLAALSFPQPAQTNAWGHPTMTPFPQPGWGNIPVTNANDSTIAKLEAEIAETKRQNEMQQLREEQRRQREEDNRRAEERDKQFRELITQVLAKPQGPSDTERAQERRIEEMQRRQEEQAREQQRREELRQMNDRFEGALREMNANKQDPMLPLFMQLLTTLQTSGAESVKAIQAAASAAGTTTERMIQQVTAGAISPIQLIQLMQSMKSDGMESSKMLMEGAKNAMDMQQNVFAQLLEIADQRGGQPAWVTIAQQAIDKVSAVGQAMAQRAQQQQRVQQQPVQQQRPVQGVPPLQQRTAVGPQMGFPPPRLNGAAGPHLVEGPETPEQIRARAAAGVEHLRAPRPVPAPEPPPVQAAVEPEVLRPPRRRRKPAAVPPLPPPALPHSYSADQLREMDSVEIAEALAAFPDDVFFGPDLLGFVANARANPPSPLDLAGYVLQGRQYVLAQEKPAPMAMELLLLGHLDVLVDRLVPEAPENYRHETVKALQALLDAEAPIAGANGDGDDDEEEEEGEEEGSAETEEETAN